jgi:hypothetical protein
MKKILSGFLIIFTAGCQQDHKIDSSHNKDIIVTVPTTLYTGGASDANYMSGSLYVKNDCLYFKLPDGRLIHPIFATKSASFRGSRLFVDDNVYKIGDNVEFGGGEPLKINSTEDLEKYKWVVKPDHKCILNEYSLVINKLFIANKN